MGRGGGACREDRARTPLTFATGSRLECQRPPENAVATALKPADINEGLVLRLYGTGDDVGDLQVCVLNDGFLRMLDDRPGSLRA